MTPRTASGAFGRVIVSCPTIQPICPSGAKAARKNWYDVTVRTRVSLAVCGIPCADPRGVTAPVEAFTRNTVDESPSRKPSVALMKLAPFSAAVFAGSVICVKFRPPSVERRASPRTGKAPKFVNAASARDVSAERSLPIRIRPKMPGTPFERVIAPVAPSYRKSAGTKSIPLPRRGRRAGRYPPAGVQAC